MGSFNNNNFISAQSKDNLFLVIFTGICTGCCPNKTVASEQRNINASTPSNENNFYESTTFDSTLINHKCQDVSSFCLTKECLETALNLMRDMDLAADPCEDFYRYTCGKWIENHQK